jgi:hypothetical protein
LPQVELETNVEVQHYIATKYTYKLIPFELDFDLIYNTLQYNSYQILQGKVLMEQINEANQKHIKAKSDVRGLVQARFENHDRY